MSDYDKDCSSAKKRKLCRLYINNSITEANKLFVRNEFDKCIAVLKNILKKAPKNSTAYFMLGLVFEEMKDDIKAYNFYLISSQLMSQNINIWQKLYDLSTKLNLLSDKIYFIQMLQRVQNSRRLVEEKYMLHKILKNKYKVLETMIEFFDFDGVDFTIFEKIKSATKHKLRTTVCTNLLIKYFKNNVQRCGWLFLMNIIRLQFDTGYLLGTRNLIENYLLHNDIILPRDIRIIYIISVLLSGNSTQDVSGLASEAPHYDIEKSVYDLNDITEPYTDMMNKHGVLSDHNVYTGQNSEASPHIFDVDHSKTLNAQYALHDKLDTGLHTREGCSQLANYRQKYIDDIKCTEHTYKCDGTKDEIVSTYTEDILDEEITFSDKIKEYNTDEDFMKLTEQLFSSNSRVFENYKLNEKTTACPEHTSYSKTLKVETLLNNTNNYEKYYDLDIFISDLETWEEIHEMKMIKNLLDILQKTSHSTYYIQILTILDSKKKRDAEYIYQKMGDYHNTHNNMDDALCMYQKVLSINPDNNYVKTKLYDIYKIIGSDDVAQKFRIITSLIRYVDDITHEDKKKYIYDADKCNHNRDIYMRVRKLFKLNNSDECVKSLMHADNTADTSSGCIRDGEDIQDINNGNAVSMEYFTKARLLVDDFLQNKFIFVTSKKYKLQDIHNNKQLLGTTLDISTNARLMSLHGLDVEEWSQILLEYIIALITKKDHVGATFILRKCLDCYIFKTRRDLYTQFVMMTIQHSIFTNDLHLITTCFQKMLSTYKDYSWANFYFYLMNFFPNYNLRKPYTSFLRNIRRIFLRNNIHIKTNKNSSTTIYSSLKVNILLSSFFVKTISPRSYKILDNIILDDNFINKMIYNLILITTFRSRCNERKDEMLKEGITGLKSLLQVCTKEQFYNLSYNIAVVYHLLGYVGIAEKYYMDALQTDNIELKRLSRLSLILIYKKNNKTLFRKYHEEDEFVV